MKKFLFPLLFIAAASYAADLSTSQTFADGDTINGAKLNNIIGQASILPGSISDRTSATPISTDYFNFWQASSSTIKKTTLATLQTGLFAGATFTGTTTISQGTVISGIISPTQIAANQNDYSPTGLSTATTLRISSDAARNITGISASGAVSGQILLLHNVGAQIITLVDESASSAAANRFALSHDIALGADGVLLLQYDGTSTRWRTPTSHTHLTADVTDLSLNPSYTTLTDGATVTITCSALKPSQNATVTLAGNRTLAMSGATAGMQGILKVVQDATGSRTLTLPAGSKVSGGGAGAVTLSTAANSIDILTWTYDGTNYFWLLNKNFS